MNRMLCKNCGHQLREWSLSPISFDDNMATIGRGVVELYKTKPEIVHASGGHGGVCLASGRCGCTKPEKR